MIGTAYLEASGAMRLLLTRRVGHRRARQVWEEADDLVMATLTYAEVYAALAAGRRNRELTEPGFGLLSADRNLCAAAQRCGMATVELDDPA